MVISRTIGVEYRIKALHLEKWQPKVWIMYVWWTANSDNAYMLKKNTLAAQTDDSECHK